MYGTYSFIYIPKLYILYLYIDSMIIYVTFKKKDGRYKTAHYSSIIQKTHYTPFVLYIFAFLNISSIIKGLRKVDFQYRN